MTEAVDALKVYLVGFKANLVTALFLDNAAIQEINLQGVIYVGRSGSLLAVATRLFLKGRVNATRAMLITNWWPPVPAVDAVSTDDGQLEAILREKGDAVFIVCGCDRILRAAHLSQGKFVNFHNSILPGNRGVAAIKWSKFNGQPVGFTFHTMAVEIDKGEVLYQHAVAQDLQARGFPVLSELLATRAAQVLPHLIEILQGLRSSVRFKKEVSSSYHSKADTEHATRVLKDMASSELIEKIVFAFEELRLVNESGDVLRLAPVHVRRPAGVWGKLFRQIDLLGAEIFLPVWLVKRARGFSCRR
ncbi:formyltransferase family protein [Roseivivax jejudonensis]|uniref:formyltransferase family protein n=1 Tax=Roseivivax jejudonensis TaxID=1529041 RepID=UPI000A26A6C9|nr:formyltransferase family protein [Roseivivax jejudonensis]